MKKIIHLFTVLMLLCSAVAFAHDFEVSGIYYNITDVTNKTVAVTYRGGTYYDYSNEYTGDVVIPESVTYNGTTYSVTSIGEDAFEDCTGLTSVEIPGSVTSIEKCAFEYCTGLTSIEIPNSVTSIGEGAFYGCTGLTSIEIPNSVTSIGNFAFEYCSGLTSIEIPNSVTSIGWYAFGNCSGLTSIEIPNSVTFIGDFAFEYCSGLTSIVIPNSVTSIGNRAFYGTAWYNNQPDGVVYAGNVLYKYKGIMPANTSIVIKEGTTAIGVYAFRNCPGLTSVVIPNSVTSIGSSAFSGCTGLTSVVIGNSVTSIGDGAFFGCHSLTSVVIPNSVTSIGSAAFSGCTGLTSVEFNAENCTTMGSSYYPVFNGCTALSTVTIGEKVKTIPDYAFYECPGLTSIEIPSSVTFIGDYAFSGCSSLTSITSLIPADKLFAVDSYVFYNVDKNACTLYVPYGAKETYASTEGWRGFKNIVELHKATFCIDGEQIATSEIKAGDAVVYPDVDEKEGYTFAWTTLIDVMPSEDIVIEGSFIVNYYTVTYTVDNEIYATDSIAYGSEIVLRDEPAKKGYTFSGWSEVPETMPANDIVIEGTFSVNTYTVTYTVDNEIYATDSIAYGSEIVLRDEPAKEGFTFSGWSEAPETMPATDIVIEGTFSVNSYTITFVVDGEVYKSMDVVYGAEIPTVEQPVKDGRKFSGWSEIPSTMPAQDVVVEGKFCYTVIFMSDGKYYSSSEVYYGSEIEVPSGMPHKEGHTFVDWNDYPDAMPARDITILATFSVNKYQLIFIIDSEVYETLYIEYGSKIEYPQKDGYIITWETENLPQTMPAENLIIIGTSALDTAVECVKDDNEKIVYTLDGHRILDVENLEKGVYIINGKKVLVK